MTARAPSSTSDTLRQVTVGLSTVTALVGSFIGSGATGGTPIAEAAGGALSASSTPVAPAGPAFAIWSVIYGGLVGYAIWQALPAQRTAERHRQLGYPIALSLLLNAAWILSVQFGQLGLSVLLIVALLAVLVMAFLRTLRWRPTGAWDAILTDGTVGLYFGWVTVATVANVAAVLTVVGFTGFGVSSDAWGALLALTAGVAGVLTAVRGRGRLTPALALAWGLAWIAVGRTTGPLLSAPTAWAAAGAALVILLVAVALRSRTGWTTKETLA